MLARAPDDYVASVKVVTATANARGSASPRARRATTASTMRKTGERLSRGGRRALARLRAPRRE